MGPVPLRFPLVIGTPMQEVRTAIHREYGGDGGYQRPLETSAGRTDQVAVYELTNPGGASVNVVYSFRESDDVIWSVRVENAAPNFTAELGRITLTDTLPSVRAQLGPSAWEAQIAPIISAVLWLRPEDGYRIEAYSATYDDIGGHHAAGELQSAEWFSLALAPSHYQERLRE